MTFSAPASGASGTFAGNSITATSVTDGTGTATAPTFTANSTLGVYGVAATAPGVGARANFALTNSSGVQVMIGASYNGTALYPPAFSVDGTSYTSNQIFGWLPGTTHTISTAVQQTVGDGFERFAFNSWSDSGAATHQITAPSTPLTVTANLTGQFLVTTSVSVAAAGSISPATGYYNAGSLTFTATPSTGYGFSEFEISGISGTPRSTSNPTTLNLAGPLTMVGDFIATTAQLTVTSTHNGAFAPGQTGAVYTLTAANQYGALLSSGTVTVTETLPAGLSLVSMSGLGWACAANACSRSEYGLSPGTSYPAITVTVNVLGNAGSQVINQVSIAGGGSASSTSTDPTLIGLAQNITFSPLSSVVYGVAPITVNPTSTSGLAVNLASSTAAVCAVTTFTITIVGGGVCTLVASQPGNSVYGVASPVTQSFAVNPANQTIAFATIPGVTLPSPAFSIGASASSGLQVTFTSNTPSVCLVNEGPTVIPLVAGMCTIAASQYGNASYNAAPTVTQSFAIKNPQTISFTAISSVAVSAGTVALTASASSGLPVGFTSNTATTCTVAGITVTLVSSGVCSITASQPGNAIFGAAAMVTVSFNVTATAAFVKVDTATQGTWKGVYGSEGEVIFSDSATYPGYAQVSLSGDAAGVWPASPFDVKALQSLDRNDPSRTRLVYEFDYECQC